MESLREQEMLEALMGSDDPFELADPAADRQASLEPSLPRAEPEDDPFDTR